MPSAGSTVEISPKLLDVGDRECVAQWLTEIPVGMSALKEDTVVRSAITSYSKNSFEFSLDLCCRGGV